MDLHDQLERLPWTAAGVPPTYRDLGAHIGSKLNAGEDCLHVARGFQENMECLAVLTPDRLIVAHLGILAVRHDAWAFDQIRKVAVSTVPRRLVIELVGVGGRRVFRLFNDPQSRSLADALRGQVHPMEPITFRPYGAPRPAKPTPSGPGRG